MTLIVTFMSKRLPLEGMNQMTVLYLESKNRGCKLNEHAYFTDMWSKVLEVKVYLRILI